MSTPRRRRQWTDRLIDESTANAAFDEEFLINPGDTDDIGKGSTLVRMIGDMTVHPITIVNNSVDSMVFAMGIGLVSAEVVAGSINVALEGEIPMSGWLWRRRITVFQANMDSLRVEFDIRAQRKLMYGEPRLFLANNVGTGPTFEVVTTGLIRSLYLLP